MKADLEEQFEAIALKAIESAERVKCNLPECRDGMRIVANQLKERYFALKEECESRGSDTSDDDD